MRPSRSRRPDATAQQVALELLARREHSRDELDAKLAARGFEGQEIDRALDSLAAQALQSDERFTESYLRARRERGYGPLRIQAELRERGVADALIEAYLEPCRDLWTEDLRVQHHKRFAGIPPGTVKERARQARVLERRGFPGEMVRQLLRELDG